MTLTPYSGIEAHHISQGSYTETGAGVLSLNASADDADRLRSLVGVELGFLKKLDDGSLLRPTVKLNWRHEFLRDGVNTTSSFVGGGGQFESSGQAVARNVYGLTARLDWEKTERLGLSVELGAEAGQKYRSLNGQLVASWRF
jgi:outer membrane autotransporter protein